MAAVTSSMVTSDKCLTSPMAEDMVPYVPESKALVALGHFNVADVSHIPSPTVLIIGDPKLRVMSPSVTNHDITAHSFLTQRQQLHRALVIIIYSRTCHPLLHVQFYIITLVWSGIWYAVAQHDFRSKHGFGRSIAAPQIGINKRFLAMNLGHG
jgi:hypothetical protein